MRFSTSPRMVVSIGTMLRFLTLSSLGYERGSALLLIRPVDLMHFALRLPITLSSHDGASLLCRIPYISTCVTSRRRTFLTLRFQSWRLRLKRHSVRLCERHLRRARPAGNGADDLICGLKNFLDNKLLFWMEGMNLIGAKYECSPLLKDAES